MSDSPSPSTEQPPAPRGPAPGMPAEDGAPLTEFPWSDSVVGMGYLPEEVGLGSGWTWSAALRA